MAYIPGQVGFEDGLTVDGINPSVYGTPVTNGGGVTGTVPTQAGTIAVDTGDGRGNPGVVATNPAGAGGVPGATTAPANLWGDEWWKQGRPDYKGTTGVDGNLDSKYRVDATAVTPEVKKQLDAIKGVSTGQDFLSSRAAVDDLYSLANTEGMTKHAQYLTDNQRLEEAASIDGLNDARSGALAGAWSELASTGGADGGSRERMSQNFYNSGMLEGQKARRQGAMQRGTILSDDEKMKIGLKQDLPNMYLGLDQHNVDVQDKNANLDLRKTGIYSSSMNSDADRDYTAKAGNRDVLVGDLGRKNAWDLDMHKEDNRGRAAKFTADATRSAWDDGGSGGGMLNGLLGGTGDLFSGLLGGIGSGVANLGNGTKKLFGG